MGSIMMLLWSWYVEQKIKPKHRCTMMSLSVQKVSLEQHRVSLLFSIRKQKKIIHLFTWEEIFQFFPIIWILTMKIPSYPLAYTEHYSRIKGVLCYAKAEWICSFWYSISLLSYCHVRRHLPKWKTKRLGWRFHDKKGDVDFQWLNGTTLHNQLTEYSYESVECRI